jgi:hypothetical protein
MAMTATATVDPRTAAKIQRSGDECFGHRHPAPTSTDHARPQTPSARRHTLHLPQRWAWADAFETCLAELRAIVLVT